MKYDFDTPIDRRGTDSVKWDLIPDTLPMWVADMDFAAPPKVLEALQRKLDTKIFGYQLVPDRFGEAVADWWTRRHHWKVDPGWVIYTTGVIPAITSIVKRITNVGDNVALMTPVYNTFYNSILNTGRHVIEAPMLYEDGEYQVDWDGLEQVLAHPLTTMMIVCNPHNPTGHVWSTEELQRIGFLCARYDVKVLADEIHCDLTLPGVNYHPFGEVCCNPDNMITCVSVSKAFNLAGLQAAAVIVPNPALRKVIDRGLNSDELAEPNAFAVAGMVAALTESADWLDELREYLADNRKAVEEFLAKELPQIHAVKQEATYLMWLDLGAIVPDTKPLCEHIRKTTGLWVIAGCQYHGNGQRFVRLNIACPRSTLLDGLERLKKGIESYKQ